MSSEKAVHVSATSYIGPKQRNVPVEDNPLGDSDDAFLSLIESRQLCLQSFIRERHLAVYSSVSLSFRCPLQMPRAVRRYDRWKRWWPVGETVVLSRFYCDKDQTAFLAGRMALNPATSRQSSTKAHLPINQTQPAVQSLFQSSPLNAVA